jgi:hypothetical protein
VCVHADTEALLKWGQMQPNPALRDVIGVLPRCASIAQRHAVQCQHKQEKARIC